MINLKLRNDGYTPENMDELELDIAAFTKDYNRQAVGPAKFIVYMAFMQTAIPKISKDVLTKEYKKQKENEDRLNQAVKILQEQKKMLEDNLHEMEDEHGHDKDALEELESKLKKASKQEKMLLERAEQEASKRQDLMNDLESEKLKNDELKDKQKKAERELMLQQQQIEKDRRNGVKTGAVSANLSKEEISKLQQESRNAGRAGRNGLGLELSDIEVASKDDKLDSDRRATTRGDDNNPKTKKKGVGKVETGKGGCK